MSPATFLALPQHARDAAYNNTAAVQDSAAQLLDFEQRSAQVASQANAQLDIRYGAAPRQLFDFFPGETGADTLLFIHGGYWQARHKNTFRFVAEGALACGMSAALIGYTLAPEARLQGIIEEVQQGIGAVSAHARAQGQSGKVLLCGWSAGAHLTAMSLASPEVVAGLGISGIYDLEPIRHTYLNQALQLTAAHAKALSPMWLAPTGPKPFIAAYGTAELPALQTQTLAFVEHGQGQCVPITDADHFSILNSLATPGALLLTKLREIARAT